MNCQYCRRSLKQEVCGLSIKTDDFKHTAGYLPNYEENSVLNMKFDKNYLEMFILKGKDDEKAGLMVTTGQGYRYVNIEYCPFCGRYLNEI